MGRSGGRNIFRTTVTSLRSWRLSKHQASFGAETTEPHLSEKSDSNYKLSCRKSTVELSFTVSFVPAKSPYIFFY